MKKSKLLIGLCALTAVIGLAACDNSEEPPAGDDPIVEATEYTVTFNSQEGSAVSAQKVKEGEKVKEPTAPTREGYTFKGWYKEASCTNAWNFGSDTVSGAVTLYAKWEKKPEEVKSYTVSFDSDGGSAVEAQKVESGKKATRPVSPTKEGYLFMGWYTDVNKTQEFDFVNDVITQNMTLYAKWEEITESITVFFNSKEGSVVAPITNVSSGSKIEKPVDPTRTGYTFVGWYKDTEGTLTEKFDFETEVVTESMTLYAKWEINVYTVTFDSDGGSVVEAQKVEYNKKATRVTPTKEGYLFMGWYTDENKTQEFDFVNTVITQNITLYAKWEGNPDEIVVFFNSKDGSLVDPIRNIVSGSKIEKPADPVREGYRFVGWFRETGGELRYEFNFETDVITESIVLFAKWEIIQTYSVTYEINGHGVQPEGLPSVTNLPESLPVLEAEGFRFEGWYLDNTTFQHQVEGGQEVTQNTTLYAKWVELSAYEKFLALGNVMYKNEFDDLTEKVYDLTETQDLPQSGDLLGYVTNGTMIDPFSETNSVSITENGLFIKDASTATTNALLYLGEISLKKIDLHIELQVDQVAGKWSILGLVNDLESLSPVISVRTGDKKDNKAPLGYKTSDKEDYVNGLAYVANQTMIIDLTLDTLHNKVSFKYTQGTNVAEFKDVELSVPVSSIYAISFGTAASASRNILVEKLAVRVESYELNEFKEAVLSQYDAFYSALGVDINYTQNKEVLIKAYTDGKAAVEAAETEEAIMAALNAAIEAMLAVESDAAISLNAKKTEVIKALLALREENAPNFTFEENQKEFERLFEYYLSELERSMDEAWIEQVVSLVMERLNSIQTDSQYLEQYKWQLLEQVREEYRRENYTSEQNESLYNETWQQMEEALNNATTREELETVIEDGRNKLALIKTDAEVLEDMKTQALEELQSFGDTADITDEIILALIEDARNDGLNKISQATTVYEVEAALNEAKDMITTQIEVASMTLEEAQTRSKDTLQSYVWAQPYPEHEEVLAAFNEGIAKIEASATNAEALQACTDAKAVIEFIVCKLTAIEELNVYKDMLQSKYYLEEAKAVFEVGYEDLLMTIKNAADADMVAKELENSIAALLEKEQDAINLELAAREEYSYSEMQNDTPKVADFVSYATEVGKGKKPTAGQIFGDFFKVTVVGTSSTKKSDTEVGMSIKGNSVWEVTTTYDNADLTLLYYSTSAGRIFTLKGPDGALFGEGTSGPGVYEANTWGKNKPYTITLGKAGTYTLEFDVNEHKLSNVTLVEKKPQVIVAKVNALVVDIIKFDAVSVGTDPMTLFENVQLELEVPGQEGRVWLPITEGYSLQLRCNGEEVQDMQQAGYYEIIIFYGSVPTQYNSYLFSVEVK